MKEKYLNGDWIQEDVESGKTVDEILKCIFDYTYNKMQVDSFEEWVRSSEGATILKYILVEKKYLNPQATQNNNLR